MCIKDYQIDATMEPTTCGPDEHTVYLISGDHLIRCEPCEGTPDFSTGPWSQCSVTCGDGSRSRITMYTNRCGSIIRHTTETTPCHQPRCPAVNGAWSSWGQFTSCDKSCGEGIQVRFRTCTNPYPSTGGQPCIGDSLQTASCNTQICPKLVTLTNPTASMLITLPPDPASESRTLRDKSLTQYKRHFLPSHLKSNKE
uniref:Coadhesin-like isoform X2 n=1 Tax=Crassostrea virginica TaxID=6565 RepID=A0A8B8BMJ2_CRAVI|nr:coadhesin-like isoform X2 [Crassostrea virginica]